MLLDSDFFSLGAVALPAATKGRQLYMHEVDLASPAMPKGFEDYLYPILHLVSEASVVAKTVWVTVDEKLVKVGETQRKPGPHVDGYFHPEVMDWHHGGGGVWNHTCNHLPNPRMPVIVASNVAACKAWQGIYEGEPKEDGDLSHLTLGEGRLLAANTGYLLTPDCIHESLPMQWDSLRTFLRIAIPV